eukprot:1393499-Amorphochlora_amoeboformis.AAC.2
MGLPRDTPESCVKTFRLRAANHDENNFRAEQRKPNIWSLRCLFKTHVPRGTHKKVIVKQSARENGSKRGRVGAFYRVSSIPYPAKRVTSQWKVKKTGRNEVPIWCKGFSFSEQIVD